MLVEGQHLAFHVSQGVSNEPQSEKRHTHLTDHLASIHEGDAHPVVDLEGHDIISVIGRSMLSTIAMDEART